MREVDVVVSKEAGLTFIVWDGRKPVTVGRFFTWPLFFDFLLRFPEVEVSRVRELRDATQKAILLHSKVQSTIH